MMDTAKADQDEIKPVIEPIRPSATHPGYWEFAGETVLLVGGSVSDNLFQLDELEAHLDTLAAAGGNVVRNTMSDRDPGDLRAFAQVPAGEHAGQYDLQTMNPAYWQRFETLLQLCLDRRIIVQIELWDRFDHSRQPWLSDPWNPANNINYTAEQSGLALDYPEHPGRNRQPMFHTPPTMADNPLLRGHQERFINKLLSISLRFANVLYCMNNETHEDPAWGRYWLEFVRQQAATMARQGGGDQRPEKDERGQPGRVYATDMFDGAWQDGVPAVTESQFDDAKMYPFVDISQVNAWRCSRSRHLRNLERLGQLNREPVRPLNNTKVYVADTLDRPDMIRASNREGVTSFWMDLLCGCASARFHRPPAGLALSETAQGAIRAVRQLEQVVGFWNLRPRFDWRGGREHGQALLVQQVDPASHEKAADSHSAEEIHPTANADPRWAGKPISIVFVPDGGSFTVELPMVAGEHELAWLNPLTAQWHRPTARNIEMGQAINAPDDQPWLAVLSPS